MYGEWKEKKKDERECSLFSVFFFLFCDYQTQVRYWYSALDFQMKFSRTQLGSKYYTGIS